MPEEAQIWTGRLPATNAIWEDANAALVRRNGRLRRGSSLTRSPYASAFTQGATFSPHLVFVVAEQSAPALGLPAGRVSVCSSRSVYERKPWKQLPSLSGVVESELVRPFYNGENVFPYRVGGTGMVVVPCNNRGLLNNAEIELSPGFSQWWERAEEVWENNRTSDRLSLLQRLDYQSTLSKQFPIAPLRIVYNRAGMHLVSVKIMNPWALVANGLYWASVQTETEADYLSAILNAPITTELVRPFMSYGKDERDIHKAPWELPIPSFDRSNRVHIRLSELGAAAERLASTFVVNPDLHFAATRRHIRQLLENSLEGREINDIVYELIS